jgi:cathepsin C
MMEELYKNGPIVVSFEPDYNFMMYKSGVYHSFEDSTWIEKGLPKPEWQKVDHSVLLVGWGIFKNYLR